MQLRQWELNRLVNGQRLPERLSRLGVLNGSINAILGSANSARRLPDPILVHEMLGKREALPRRSEDGVVTHDHAIEGHLRSVGLIRVSGGGGRVAVVVGGSIEGVESAAMAVGG